MAFGPCDMRIVRRRGASGASVRLAMRLDPAEVTELIRDLAASIGMRVTLAPLSGPQEAP